MYVIGTAGHVDHGKSTLVEALTGIDPDRLAEEKERAMTIDLGFAWMEMEIGGRKQEVGVVDVPGHRDFIENMLAGIGGIDLALFVVAADEGVMPQTSEHLAIIDLLGVPSAVIALTKVDLVDDPDWLELVTIDLHEHFSNTVLEDAPIVPVSAQTGAGLELLREELVSRLLHTPQKPDQGRPRLPIDRVFSLSGFGTIVTGTLVGGSLQLGDTVEIQPGSVQGRIRGLQTHKTKRQTVTPGSRVAVNIAGIDASDLRRGMVVARPGQLRETILIDATYRHLSSASGPLKHNVEVKVYLGAAEVMGRTRVLGAREIGPGESGWLQLALSEPVAVDRGDRFILRRPSPGATLGGGRVLDPHPGRRHRRFQPRVVERLQTLSTGTPEEMLLHALERVQPSTIELVIRQSGLDRKQAIAVWEALLEQAEVIKLGQQAVTQAYWLALRQRILSYVVHYHEQYPLRSGIPREELRSRLELELSTFNMAIRMFSEEGLVEDTGSVIREPGYKISFDEGQRRLVDELLRQFQGAGVNSPSVKDCKVLVGIDVFEALVETGQLTQLNDEVVYRSNDFEKILQTIITYMEGRDSASAGEIRDLLQTSRKYAIALLEYLDQQRITRRVGDERVLVVQRS